jgi:anti-sigma B factor antagonist
VAVVRTRGPVTVQQGSSALGRGIAEALKRGHTRLVINLAGSRFIDSAGLGELVAAMKQSAGAGGGMAVVASLEIREILSRLHLDSVLALKDSEEAALADLAGRPSP